jgi:hypothetical protein
MTRGALLILVIAALAGCHQNNQSQYKANPKDPYDVRVTDTAAHGEMSRNCFSPAPTASTTQP